MCSVSDIPAFNLHGRFAPVTFCSMMREVETHVPFSQHNPAYHPGVCFQCSGLITPLNFKKVLAYPNNKNYEIYVYSYIILESRLKIKAETTKTIILRPT
jgi:hypothetical protein